MFYFDWWYKPVKPESCDVDVNFLPNEGLYRGNMYKKGTNSCIGDFVSDDSTEIEKYWPYIFKTEEEMKTNKKDKIEKVIKVLIDMKELKDSLARRYKFEYEDAKAKEKGKNTLRIIKEMMDDYNAEVKRIEDLIDFMQELHYEEAMKS